MLKLVRSLFRRYVDQHRVITRTAGSLRDAEGRLLAEAAEVKIKAGRVRVRVRAPGGAVAPGFAVLDGSGFLTPMVAEEAGTGWFTATVPEHWGRLRLAASASAASVALPGAGRFAGAGVAAMAPGFALRLLPVLAKALRWRRDRDPALKLAILEALGLASRQPALLDAHLFRPAAGRAEAPPRGPVTIILPIHNALDLLGTTIGRIEANTDLPWHLIAIEDASTDARVRPWLRERLAALPAGCATLIENARNLGFIESVNLGFACALERGDPVVLLNSDAFVPQGWASRLLAPLEDASVASVTPMSNEAELLTVPAIGHGRPLAPGQGDAIDRIAAAFAPGAGLAGMPTGVGFCMAISRGWLARVPRFDPGFGRGYGEEVDWCQKVLALGGRHVGLPGLFVEHYGGASFGSAEKQAAIARNNKVIAARHPRFFEDVRAFTEADPLATPRLALGVALAAGVGMGDAATPLYVAHSLGGGADVWLRDRIAADLEAPAGAALVLRLGGIHRWQLELHLRDTPVQAGASDDLATIRAILAPVPRLHLRYSCAVGDPDPAALPQALLDLTRPQDGLEVLFHDFLPLSPSYTLLDSEGRFRGVPAADDADPAHQSRRADGCVVTLRDWRSAWGRLAARAERLVAFSQDSAAHVAVAWPELAARIDIQPHVLHTPVPRCEAPPPGQPFNIAVLGNIGLHKGIALVAELARRLDATPGTPGLVVIGRTDPAWPLPASVKVHGSYAIAELDLLARRYAIGAWLIPSVCPETFSYTTHEALATGLPVVGLGLGAQGEALAGHENGRVIAWDRPDVMLDRLVEGIMNLRAEHDGAGGARPAGNATGFRRNASG